MTRTMLPPPISGGLLLSYRCTVRCRHCMYACSPKWKGDWITTDELKMVLYQLSRSIMPSPRGGDGVSLNPGLHFTGGEPFLNGELLFQAVQSVKGECSAGHKKGDTCRISCWDTGGLCGFLCHDIFPSLSVFQFGGKHPWSVAEELTLECPDRENAVSLRIRTS